MKTVQLVDHPDCSGDVHKKSVDVLAWAGY